MCSESRGDITIFTGMTNNGKTTENSCSPYSEIRTGNDFKRPIA
jgi:hypothetical protein